MTAFNSAHTNLVQMAIAAMHTKHNNMDTCPVTDDDILTLFVKPEDHAICRRANELFASSRYGGRSLTAKINSDSVDTEFNVALHNGVDFMLPDYAKNIMPDAPNDVVMRLTDWVMWRRELSLRYGRVRQLFNHLNELCSVPSQIKFLWPSVEVLAALCCNEGDQNVIYDKLNSGTRKSLPPVGPELRAACQETATTIAMWQMLPEPPVRPSIQVGVSVELSGTSWRAPRDTSALGAYHGI